MALHSYMGTEFLLVAVCPDSNQYLRPYIFTSSDWVSEFFSLSLQHSLSDVAMRLEAYCLSGIDGKYLCVDIVDLLISIQSRCCA
jgi:hypothetical protein